MRTRFPDLLPPTATGAIVLMSAWLASAAGNGASPVNTAAPPPVPHADARVLAHDRTAIRVAAQAGDGTVWSIAGSSVSRWIDRRWEAVESTHDWPGSILELVPDPARPGELVH